MRRAIPRLAIALTVVVVLTITVAIAERARADCSGCVGRPCCDCTIIWDRCTACCQPWQSPCCGCGTLWSVCTCCDTPCNCTSGCVLCMYGTADCS